MKRPALYCFPIIALVVLLVYWPGLHGQFLFDDYPNIVLDKSLLLKSFAPGDLWLIFNGGTAGPLGRGAARLSFALNYYLAGLDPFAFKATNLVIHLCNGYLIYLLARRCLMTVGGARVSDIGTRRDGSVALFVSAVWLLHPIQLLPVLHVVQRMTSLAACFVFLAMLLHIKGRVMAGRRAIPLLLAAWLIVWPLGFLSKETALLFPVFAVLWELLLNRHRVGRLDGFARCLVMLVGVAGGLLLGYFLSARGAWLWAGYQLRDFTLFERLLTEARVVWKYVALILLPKYEAFALYHDDFVVSRGLWDPPITALALLSLCALLALGWASRRTQPLIAFGIFWFFSGHLLESSILPLELMHEHRNYLPTFGLFLAAGAFFGKARFFRERDGVWLILGGAFLVYCAFLTALRSHQFGDELRRSQIEAQHHRQSPAAHIDAGRVLANSEAAVDSSGPAYALAIRHYEIASELDPKAKMGLAGMIGASCKAHVQPKTQWLDALAIRLHDKPFAPGDKNVLYYLKEVAIELPECLSRRQMTKLFESAATNEKAQVSAVAAIRSWAADYYWLGLHDLPSARDSLNLALSITPANLGMRLKKAQLDYLAGNFEAARREMDLLKRSSLGVDEAQLFEQLVPLIYGQN